MKKLEHWVVLYWWNQKPVDTPMAFTCQAEDHKHAEEQCENAYPGCRIAWTYGDDGRHDRMIDNAYEDYFNPPMLTRDDI